jgi:hypothetical protein
MLGNEDAYYSRRDDSFVMPAYRVILIGAKADVPGLRMSARKQTIHHFSEY